MRKLLIIIPVILLLFSCKKDNNELTSKYLQKLSEYSVYDDTDTSRIKFAYMDSNDPDLQNLKVKYDLATIAGVGNDLSKITNLMFWVNENIRHDGSSQNPNPPNADNIIETTVNEDRGVNCRMLGIVLNDFYLAMGFKSRFVTCKPFEHDFNDCHVVVAVYSTQLNKWIMTDPSFAGYFKDGDGNFLGLSEVRERFINDDVLIISDYLNHNGDLYSKREYKKYMSKNLFRLSCPLKSEYNYEAMDFNLRCYVELVPVDYQHENSRNYIYTENPDVYWAEP
jgi:hypothetical protein